MGMLRAIGNMLGTFLEADMSFLVTKERKVAQILLQLDTREGLANMMQIQVHGYSFSQILDCEKLALFFHHCHKYGHLERDFPLSFCRHKRHQEEPELESSIGEEVEVEVQ